MNVLANIFHNERLSIKIVHRNIEKTLDLAGTVVWCKCESLISAPKRLPKQHHKVHL